MVTLPILLGSWRPALASAGILDFLSRIWIMADAAESAFWKSEVKAKE